LRDINNGKKQPNMEVHNLLNH